MRNRHIAHLTTATAITALALTACSVDTGDDAKAGTPKATAAKTSATPDTSAALADSGIPSKPTGARRQALLDALTQASPDVVKYEDKAIDAARNQCGAINGGAQKLDYLASQRFTYQDVVTSEAQGKRINEALEETGFCTS
ncbi:hypothetical protein OHU34_06295 [Streptomyces sp. NBC_00080]|uniref:hypothetical protein n=1 Tax=unclassified Streptomyces TaxID=2593676 RepID=UPI0011541131|nr:hypothetical protein [Streptomyces sp. SLBN-115]TQJ57243.1 hypothetical protein FBY34_5089 [Streptomyces sp. SLBN-115]